VMFANITEWSPQAQRYFLSEDGLAADGTFCCLGLAEHHAPKHKTGKLRAALGFAGFRMCIVPASGTGRPNTGTRGGVAAGVLKRHSATMRDPSSPTDDGEMALHGDGWAVVIIHRRGLDIAYVTCYFECGGMGVSNRRRAIEIRTCLSTLGIPWVIAADFNMTPQEITENGLQRILGGRIRTPAGAVYTCTAGQKRLLDFWLVSDKAELFTDNYRIVPGTPWKPRSTIAFDLPDW